MNEAVVRFLQPVRDFPGRDRHGGVLRRPGPLLAPGHPGLPHPGSRAVPGVLGVLSLALHSQGTRVLGKSCIPPVYISQGEHRHARASCGVAAVCTLQQIAASAPAQGTCSCSPHEDVQEAQRGVCSQIAFCGVAYPSLVITYFGQAAFLMANPDQVRSTGSGAVSSRPHRHICYGVCLRCVWLP